MIYTFLHSLDLIAGPNSETDGVSTDEMLQVDIVLVQYSVLTYMYIILLTIC